MPDLQEKSTPETVGLLEVHRDKLDSSSLEARPSIWACLQSLSPDLALDLK